jgi:periplasmic iron binding protein
MPFYPRVAALLMALAVTLPASAIEYPIGRPHHLHGMQIGAVYLQPVAMEPAGMMLEAAQADIHLEMDINASAGNPNGFAEGAWIPYLQATYELRKHGSDWHTSGVLMPMVASDGPHYGDNVKLDGPGRYQLTFKISPPSLDGHGAFGRHSDRLTGVRPWFKPFEVDYTFVYAGTGKKGGY